MGNAGSKIGHFFQEDVRSMGDFLSMAAAPVLDTFGGITSGNFDYSNWSRDWENYNNDIINAFSGKNTRISSTPSFEKQLGQEVSKADKATAINNMKDVSTVPTWYSRMTTAEGWQGSIKDVVPPSQISKIADPGTKMALSSARGNNLKRIQVMQHMGDALAAPAFRSAANSGANIGSGTSEQLAAAGGSGPSTSGDVRQNELDTATGGGEKTTAPPTAQKPSLDPKPKATPAISNPPLTTGPALAASS